ncbi:alpha/beta fold hydrolase [Streptomyces roseicoloratus]|uniref:Alpha/beta hydrolase n=1 Tax=Streptomyces roseicoloratus TaxID=2508722 RepID=A0ABY9RV59_9ACTN|nr:alpha/beta hydrolase [Streptomyces roseicoloratus]WMX45638.1 alpha/beta hydrolase [Streptomyces roseicoloratus]
MPYADVNGMSLWYEEHGESGESGGSGEPGAAGSAEPPLVLLHGGFGAGEMFQPFLAAGGGEGRRVITVDLQAHGRTPDVAGRPMSGEAMADDVAGLLEHLGAAPADVLGYSLGAGAALRLAIQRPDLVRRLVVVSLPARRSGWFPEVTAQMDRMDEGAAEALKQSPMYELYERIAPRVEDWPVLVEKVTSMNRRDYDWTGEIAGVTAPVLLVFADGDGIRPAHMVEFFGLLGGGLKDPGWDGAGRPSARLAVIPGATHYDLMLSPLLPAVVGAFLAEEAAGKAAGKAAEEAAGKAAEEAGGKAAE